MNRPLSAAASAALTLSFALTSARSAHALTLSHCDFSDVSDLALNGSAAQSGALLALTDGLGDEAGSAYCGVAVPWSATTSFHTDFQFQMVPDVTGAEGLSFIFQDVGATALGGDSYRLGYSAISPSVEVEFDTYMDSWDPNANHVAIMTNGAYKTHLAYGTPAFTMAGGGVLYAWIDYDAATTELDVYLAQTGPKPAAPIVSFDVPISGTAFFVGFTSATGGAPTLSEQDILEWEFSTDGVPCACIGGGECPSADPVCATTGPSAGLCVAASTDGGVEDAASDASDDVADVEAPDGSLTHDGGAHEGGTKDGGGTHDAGASREGGAAQDGGRLDAGPRPDGGSSQGERLSGGACTYAPNDPSSDVGPFGVLALLGLASVAARRRLAAGRGR
jgi:Legume lectin domain